MPYSTPDQSAVRQIDMHLNHGQDRIDKATKAFETAFSSGSGALAEFVTMVSCALNDVMNVARLAGDRASLAGVGARIDTVVETLKALESLLNDINARRIQSMVAVWNAVNRIEIEVKACKTLQQRRSRKASSKSSNPRDPKPSKSPAGRPSRRRSK